MFLFDPGIASDWDQLQTELNRLFERSGASVITMGKWDERRLAYEIKGRKRGIYALAYFKAEPDKIVAIERDAQLSEMILRCMILRVDHMSEEEMQEAVKASRPSAGPSGDDRDRDRDDRRQGGRDTRRGERPKSDEPEAKSRSSESSDEADTVPVGKNEQSEE
jgi:ribosomal protein S6